MPNGSREHEELSQHKLLTKRFFFSALPRFLLFPGNRGAQIQPLCSCLSQGSATWALGLGIGPSDFTGEDGGGLVGVIVHPPGPLGFAFGFGFALGLASTAWAFAVEGGK